MPRKRQLVTFLTVFALILATLHFYLYQRIAYYLQLDTPQRALLAATFGLLALLVLLVLPLSRMLPRTLARVLAWVAYPWMGLGFLLCTGFLLTDCVWLIANLLGIGAAPTASLQRDFGVAALGLIGCLGVYALWRALGPVRTREVTVHLKKLPPTLDGLRLAQISDIHIGPLLGGRWLRRVVARVNALEADVVAITGDLADGSVSELRAHVAPLGELRARHGAYFVTGNHEYYSGVEAWCGHVEDLGITVLRNRHVSIGVAGEGIDIAGVDDWSSRHAPRGHDLSAALRGRDASRPLVLLAHQPLSMHEAAAHGVDLQLSGHTHGGQIWPFTYFVYLQQPIAQGLFQYPDADLQIYVSPGTGFWGPPMRLGAWPEITCITLRRMP